MNNKQLKEYLNNIEFKLKDIKKTYDLYKGYKTNKFLEINKDFKRFSQNDIYNMIENYSVMTGRFRNRLEKANETKSKSDIRLFKTCINNRMRESLTNWVNYDNNLNNNEQKNFTIRLYLANYREINKAMKDYLKDCIL